MTTPDFEAMVTGLPADEGEATAQFRAELQARGSRIANTSALSPFFLLLAAIVTAPVLAIRQLIVGTILPGLFSQTATGALLDQHAAGMDEARLPAARAQGLLTFTREGTSGALVVPAGTVVESPEIDGVVYRLVTTAVGNIVDGADAVAVPAEAEGAGAAWNLGDGYYSILPVAVPGITRVANASGWLTSPGRDTETDDALRERLRKKWRQQSGWHTADTYRALISQAANVRPEQVLFDLSSPRGPGSADAYVYTDTGLASAAQVTAADEYINAEGNHGLGDDVRVKALPALPVALDVTLTAVAHTSAADKAQLAADAEQLLRAAFREHAGYPAVPRFTPYERVSRSALAGHLHEAFAEIEAVDWVAPAADPQPGLALPVIAKAVLDAGLAVDLGSGLVGLPAAAHGLAGGTRISLAGTAAYDGVHTLDAATTADELVIAAAYVAEAFTGAETVTALVVTVP